MTPRDFRSNVEPEPLLATSRKRTRNGSNKRSTGSGGICLPRLVGYSRHRGEAESGGMAGNLQDHWNGIDSGDGGKVFSKGLVHERTIRGRKFSIVCMDLSLRRLGAPTHSDRCRPVLILTRIARDA